jgi:uncharacterized protein YjbI with pentapeptide repeats
MSVLSARRSLMLGAMCVVSSVLASCGVRESATGVDEVEEWIVEDRDRNASSMPSALVNGVFDAAGGGWISNGSPVGAGCTGRSGEPSLGGWKANALTFGYSRRVVEQSIAVVNPATVTLRVEASVRGDQSNSTFVVSLKSGGATATSGMQTGATLVTPKEFVLSVDTVKPSEVVTVQFEGSSASYWAGCYGPIFSNARVEVVPKGGPMLVPTTAAPGSVGAAVIASSTTLASESTVAPTSSAVSVTSVAPSSPVAPTTVVSPTTVVTPTTVVPATSVVPPATVAPVAAGGSSATAGLVPVNVETRTQGDCVFSPGGSCVNVLDGRLGSLGRLADARLAGWKAWGSDLTGAVLANSDFSRADFHMARLDNSDVTGANFTLANFVGASLAGVSVNPKRWDAEGGPSVSFQRANLSHADIAGANLIKADLTNAVLVGANLSGADLSESNLEGVDLRGANLTGVFASDVEGTPRYLPVGFSIMKGHIVGPGVRLGLGARVSWDYDNTNLFVGGRAPANSEGSAARESCANSGRRAAYTTRQSTDSTDFRSTTFGVRDLSGVDFSSLDLARADFRGANLTRASFAGADLSNALFEGATLVDVDLAGADITGVDFSRVAKFERIRSKCTFAQLERTGGRPLVTLPRGWRLAQGAKFVRVHEAVTERPDFDGVIVRYGYLLGRTAVLANESLVGVDFASDDLSSALLEGVSSASIDGVPLAPWLSSSRLPLLPKSYGFSNSVLIGPDVDLSGVIASGLDMRRIDLSSARFFGSSLSGLVGDPKLPSGSKIVKGVLLAPGVVVRSQNFGDASFAGIDLTAARFYSTDLGRVRLAGVKSSDTIFDDGRILPLGKSRLPANYVNVAGLILGPGVDLSNTVLSSDNFMGRPPLSISGLIDLTGANLAGANWRDLRGSFRFPFGWGVNKSGELYGPTASIDGFSGRLDGLDPAMVKLPGGYVPIGGQLFGPGLVYERITKRATTKYPLDISGAKGDLASVVNMISAPSIRGEDIEDRFFVRGPISRYGVTEKGVLVGPNVDLRRVDLSGDRLPVSNLSDALLDGVRGVGVTFTDERRPVLPRGWVYTAGLFLGPRADLSNANLSGLDLSNVDLSEATLDNARGSNITGNPRLPQGWRILDKTLVGPTANLVCSAVRRPTLRAAGIIDFRGKFGSYFDPGSFGVDRVERPLC